MSDYHSNDNTWDRHDPVDPHSVRCLSCGGVDGRHDDNCRTDGINFDNGYRRKEDDPCERNTVGCCVHHTATGEEGCETW